MKALVAVLVLIAVAALLWRTADAPSSAVPTAPAAPARHETSQDAKDAARPPQTPPVVADERPPPPSASSREAVAEDVAPSRQSPGQPPAILVNWCDVCTAPADRAKVVAVEDLSVSRLLARPPRGGYRRPRFVEPQHRFIRRRYRCAAGHEWVALTVRCPACGKDGRERDAVAYAYRMSAKGYLPHEDRLGRRHYHDANIITAQFACDGGHGWNVWYQGHCWCGWQAQRALVPDAGRRRPKEDVGRKRAEKELDRDPDGAARDAYRDSIIAFLERQMTLPPVRGQEHRAVGVTSLQPEEQQPRFRGHIQPRDLEALIRERDPTGSVRPRYIDFDKMSPPKNKRPAQDEVF